MQFLPPSEGERWLRLRDAWRSLPPHSNVIQALAVREEAVLLKYAPLNWLGQPVHSDSLARLETRQIIQLASVYQMLLEQVPGKLDLFLNPLVKFDLGSFIRVA